MQVLPARLGPESGKLRIKGKKIDVFQESDSDNDEDVPQIQY